MIDYHKVYLFVGASLLAVAPSCVGQNERHDELLPIARAGDDLMATADTFVTLDGSASIDPLGGKLAYQWTLVQKPDEARVNEPINNKSKEAQLYVPVVGTYVVSLVVAAVDSDRVSASDYVTIYVSEADNSQKNSVPKARMGLLLPTYCSGEEIILDGGDSYDADSDELTYNWSIQGRSAVDVPDKNKAQTTAYAPEFKATSGNGSLTLNTYAVNLVVGDGKSYDRTIEDFKVASAVARISGPHFVNPGETFTLEGETSCADGDSDSEMTYEWFEASSGTQRSLRFVPNGSSLEVISPAQSGVTIDYVLKINDGAATATFPVTTK